MKKNRSKETPTPPVETADAIVLLHKRYVAGQPKRAEQLARLRDDAELGRKLADLRRNAGLSTRTVASRAGITARAIEEVESGKYEGDLLDGLRRIATALGKQVEIRFVSLPKKS